MRPIPHPDDGAFAAVTDGWTQCGLTKRELFAAMAMQGMAADPGTNELSAKDVALLSVVWADALLAELAKKAK